ncbi:hypothetical protein PRIC1_005588 [Phytophthora ramorum]
MPKDVGRSAWNGDNKASVMESGTPSASSSSVSSCSSGDGGGKPTAGLVASYLLRTARDWRGSAKVDTLEQRADKDQQGANQAKYGNGNQVLDVEGTSEAQGGEKEMDPVEVEAEPDATTGDSQLTVGHKEKEFEVTYHCLPDVEEGDQEEDFEGLSTGEKRGRRPMQYLDVLLQTDGHGVGLNVGLGEEDGRSVLVVQSFRRLNEGDRGPAEMCEKIRVGDILHAVDGEDVGSLQQLHSKLARRLGERRKFVLLRFLRPVVDESEAALTSSLRTRSTDTSEARWAEIDALLRINPHIAVLVRQLATTNQMLQDQLIDSRLKQEEQNIQLDQLHALYARTQAEGLPLFSLSKSIRPFSRKAGGDVESGKPIPTKIQTEVMEAVSAEHARLRQEFQLQHVLVKRELERKYTEKAKQLEEATAKKVKMLESGFQEALKHYASDHSCSCHYHATPESSNSGSSLHQHDYSDDARRTNAKDPKSCRRDTSYAELDKIMKLLAEYEEIKYLRTAKLQALSSITVDSSTSEIND